MAFGSLGSFGAFAPLTPEEMDLRLRAKPSQGAFGLSGGDPSGAAAMQMPGEVPATPFGFNALPGPSAAMARESVPRPVRAAALPVREDEPATPNAPLPPARPPEFGSSAAPEPAPAPTAAVPKADAGPALGSRFLSGLGSNADLFLSLGQGLLSQKGFGSGLAAGTALYQKAQQNQAATDLARAKFANEQAKFNRENAGITANAGIVQKAYPGLTPEQASAVAANQSNVSEALKIIRNGNHGSGAPEGFRLRADGQGYEPLPGGPQDPETIRVQAEARAPDREMTPLTDPTARLKAGIRQDDKRSAWIDANGKVTFEPGQPNTQVTVNNAVNPILKGLGDQFVEGAASARSAADQVRSITSAREQLDRDGGLITGFRANDRLALQKVGALLGVTDPSAIQNTESLRAALKPMVLESIKALGTNPSNNDLTFANGFSGGDITLDEGSIRRIMDLNERAARAKIERHNALADKMLTTQPDLGAVGPMLRIDLPSAYVAPAPAQTTPAAPAQAAPTAPTRPRRVFDPATGAFR